MADLGYVKFGKSSTQMRRHTALHAETPAAAAPEDDKLPSNAVVDMFGRLFGIILATLCENRMKGSGSFSEF
jgi:hypothetical protein